ncbi:MULTISPECIES: TrkA family potassium uptake protein [unclassified Halanaerobium]|uniref:potassium channel family protein n=1 Tax=unclassified Halanaerobium TaxID=2641197 RepID=UPI000DF2C3EC|nr:MULTISPECIES: TrkA family potassium uptake protein [unclassified Halanaerobium]RCW47744.1 trk system potassium uptake protein TrkA [Halanaerobium sp. MA284_MarDTE_T2]RCW81781.1 trk system potassium uptake protein TrkA [Halanaerobium sp. DL-01]
MKQFIVIGLGRFGSSVATTLSENGYDVLAIDSNQDKVQAITDKVTHAVRADATDENTLKALGVGNFDVAVVSIGDNISANVLCTLILKELLVPYVIVKSPHSLHGKVLTKVGADRVVYPERDMGSRIAHNLISSNVLDYIEFAPEYGVLEIVPIENMVGKTLKEIGFRSKFNVNVMAIKRGEDLLVSPGAEDKINEGDRIVLMGKNNSLEKIRDYNG